MDWRPANRPANRPASCPTNRPTGRDSSRWRRAAVVALAALTCAPTVVLAQQDSVPPRPARAAMPQPPTYTMIEGFAVRYAAPEGWRLSGQDGRIQAWSNATGTAALVFYAGHFSSLTLALGDAQRVLGVPSDDDTRVITPLAATTFGRHGGLAGSVRVVGERALVSHVAVVQLNDSTMLGGVAVLDASVTDSALAATTAALASVLSVATVRTPVADSALRGRLAGRWEFRQSGGATVGNPVGGAADSTRPPAAATGTSGSYTNEEMWEFASSGEYRYTKQFTVTVPGSDVTPESRDERGRWYAVGGALVLIGDDGRLTVDVRFDDGTLVLDGTRFTRMGDAG